MKIFKMRIDLRERFVTPPTRGRERGRMGTFDNTMAFRINGFTFLLSKTTPEDENKRTSRTVQQRDDSISKVLPRAGLIGMGIGVASLHSESGVEHQDSLLGPAGKIAVGRGHKVGDIVLQLLVDVEKRWGRWNAWFDRETEPVRLSFVDVGILPYQYHFHPVQWRQVEGFEHFFHRWVDRLSFAQLLLEKCFDGVEIGRSELFAQRFLPFCIM